MSTLAAVLSSALSVSLAESCERLVRTWGASAAGGGEGGALVLWFCHEHPDTHPAATIARVAAIEVPARQIAKKRLMAGARLTAAAVSADVSQLFRKRVSLLPKYQADNDKRANRGYVGF